MSPLVPRAAFLSGGSGVCRSARLNPFKSKNVLSSTITTKGFWRRLSAKLASPARESACRMRNLHRGRTERKVVAHSATARGSQRGAFIPASCSRRCATSAVIALAASSSLTAATSRTRAARPFRAFKGRCVSTSWESFPSGRRSSAHRVLCPALVLSPRGECLWSCASAFSG